MASELKEVVFQDEWPGLYRESWKGVIVDEAFAHPAKFSRALIQQIYEHVIEERWANKGGSVIDPFGGVALGAFPAMQHGLSWIGCELEAKFVTLGNQNIALWNERYSRMPNWGAARLLQGDSRKLGEVLSEASCCVSSPPYAGNEKSDYQMSEDGKTRRRDEKRGFRQGHGCFRGSEGAYGQTEGQLGAMKEGDHSQTLAISSPPYIEPCGHGGGKGTIKQEKSINEPQYGHAPGQIAEMPEGDHSIAITSPPYVGCDTKPTQMGTGKPTRADGDGAGRNKGDYHYGNSDGQLGAMPEGQLAISSPPFERSTQVNNTPGDMTAGRPRWEGGADSAARVKQDYADYANERNLGNMRGGFDAAVSSPPFMDNNVNIGAVGDTPAMRQQIHNSTQRNASYGATKGQLGNESAETFWSASRLILEQLHQVIVPGGHAVFVVKAFVRDKKIVDFPAQWAQLCEAVGFRLLHHHRASLVEHSGTQGGFEEDKEIRVERKSFFRRLAEKKGSPRIDHESVLCFIRL